MKPVTVKPALLALLAGGIEVGEVTPAAPTWSVRQLPDGNFAAKLEHRERRRVGIQPPAAKKE